MDKEALYVLSSKDIYVPCVCNVEYEIYNKDDLHGLNAVFLQFEEDKIDIYNVSKQKKKNYKGELITSIALDELVDIKLYIHRTADMAIRSDRPIAYYVFISRIEIDLVNKKQLKFRSNSIALLAVLYEKLTGLDYPILIEDKHLELIDTSLTYVQQYDKLVENAVIFDKNED